MTRYLRPIALALCAVALAHFAAPATAAERSRTVARQFERMYHCPATGRKTGPCPGWVIDHRIPLCAGGPDSVGNLSWEPIAEARAKDAEERRLCRLMHRGAIPVDIGRDGLCQWLVPSQWPLLTKALCASGKQDQR